MGKMQVRVLLRSTLQGLVHKNGEKFLYYLYVISNPHDTKGEVLNNWFR